MVSIRVKTLRNTNLVSSRHIIKEKGSLTVEVRLSKTSLPKLPVKTAHTSTQPTQINLINRLSAYQIFSVSYAAFSRRWRL